MSPSKNKTTVIIVGDKNSAHVRGYNRMPALETLQEASRLTKEFRMPVRKIKW